MHTTFFLLCFFMFFIPGWTPGCRTYKELDSILSGLMACSSPHTLLDIWISHLSDEDPCLGVPFVLTLSDYYSSGLAEEDEGLCFESESQWF